LGRIGSHVRCGRFTKGRHGQKVQIEV
jgi:hypothetical protein